MVTWSWTKKKNEEATLDLVNFVFVLRVEMVVSRADTDESMLVTTDLSRLQHQQQQQQQQQQPTHCNVII